MAVFADIWRWFVTQPLLSTLLGMMGLDITLGILRALGDKRICSDISGRGMRRKAGTIFLVLGCMLLARAVGAAGIGEAVAVFFIISELISITENAGLLGAP